jgi:hypothetical protein
MVPCTVRETLKGLGGKVDLKFLWRGRLYIFQRLLQFYRKKVKKLNLLQ